MNIEIEKKWIAETAADIKAHGFRVFLADSGIHGFYTDKDGTRVICFGIDLLRTTFSGKYETDNPKQTGTGWRIADTDGRADYKAMFNTYPPQWAIHNAKWKFTTVEHHLRTYQASSKYKEI